MSSIAVNAITDANAGNTATINAVTPNVNNVLGKNRIINGNMMIDQRNAGAAVTINSTSNTYTLDRWAASGQLTDGVYTVEQITEAPAGFANSARITVTTADASIGATQVYLLQQFVEGFNFADLDFGKSSAKSVTLSFWARSSVTGTFSGALGNSANDRAYPFTYAISSANTWEYKTITIAGDTTGTWLTDSGRGVAVRFAIGLGSNYVATAGAWTGTSSIFGATGAVNLIETLSATLDITGVQLETGSSATEFEHRQYGTELSLCQRYYQLGGSGASGQTDATTTVRAVGLTFPVAMRSTPSGAMATASITTLDFGTGAVTNASPTFDTYIGTNTGGWIKITGWVAGTAYRGTVFTTDSIALSAEL
jgi:hypothetical protein